MVLSSDTWWSLSGEVVYLRTKSFVVKEKASLILAFEFSLPVLITWDFC